MPMGEAKRPQIITVSGTAEKSCEPSSVGYSGTTRKVVDGNTGGGAAVVVVVLVLVVVLVVVDPVPVVVGASLVLVLVVVAVVVVTHVSQSVPEQLHGQMQMKPFPVRMHCPPFTHGFGV